MNISRRSFVKRTGLWAALTLLPGGLLSGKSEEKPNIIYIMADDLGYGDLSCYGQKKFKTPNIDRLASEGMKFTQHYSGSTVCAPSRCSLMTGLHTGHCQIRGNREVKPEGQTPMKPGTVTIPTLLKKAGYVSGMFGKWGLGAPGSDSDPMLFFDDFFGYNCQRQAHNYYPGHLWDKKEKIKLMGRKYSHDLIMKEAMNFIRNNKYKPFFCYMPVTIPHAAMHAPKLLHDKYRSHYSRFEDKIGKYAGPRVKNPIAAFPAMMEHLDNGVGQVLDLLKELDIEKNTLVIFTSDNGPHREGGHDPKFWNSSGPLKGIKRDLYEGGIRVPFLTRWPGTIKPGRVSKHISAMWDMMPTFCEMAGVDPPKDIDGISFLPTLLGEKQKEHEYLYWEFPARGGIQAIRKGDFKAVRKNLKKDPNGKIELYNLAVDPGEKKKKFGKKHPEIVREMKELFKKARIDSEIFKLF